MAIALVTSRGLRMSQTQTAATRRLDRSIPSVDVIFFLALGMLAVSIGVAISLQ